MFCPNCSLPARPNSKFCPHCGRPLATQAKPAANLPFVNQPFPNQPFPQIVSPLVPRGSHWEYKEYTYPSDPNQTMQDVARKSGQKVYAGITNSYTITNALNDIWVSTEGYIRSDLRSEFEQGWEADPSSWGPGCIEYQTRTVGMSHWGGGQWLIYIIIGFVSYGIGFLILPFLMRYQILEPLRVKVRLRRSI